MTTAPRARSSPSTGVEQLPVTGARLHAAPARVRGVGTFPVRAYAVIPG